MNILFISHSAGYTGAPFLLVNLLEWFKKNTSHNIRVLLKNDGPLRSEFSSLAETVSVSQFSMRVENRERCLLKHYQDVDIIYSNTGTNGHILVGLAPLNRPVVTHLHEMRYALAMWGENAFDHVLAQTTKWICVSRPVKENLCINHGVHSDKAEIIPACITLPSNIQELAQKRLNILQALGLREPARIILGAGTFDWRKGADIFLQVAAQILKLHDAPDLHFVWLGDEGMDETTRLRTSIEVGGLGIAPRLHLLPFRSDVLEFMAHCEIFLLSSREDPCPLVALEAAALGKPVVCFQKAGGIADFVSQGAGIATPFMDTQAMAKAVCDLLDNPATSIAMGKRGAKLVETDHDLSINASKINTLLQEVMAQSLIRKSQVSSPANRLQSRIARLACFIRLKLASFALRVRGQ